ncbi:glycosyltransferase [Photobacterium damselae]|uniref:glycosyltransferase n=1 Tax=Photobacterium damselae TaxID=38293 RepID=UPI001D052EAB|nr:glycosyltransferase [Photobacterium damselae]
MYNLKPGGAEGVFVKIANHLYNSGFDVTFVLVQKEGVLLDKVDNNIDIINLNSKHILLSIIPLIKIINTVKPDYILSTLKENNAIAIISNFLSRKKAKVFIREANTLSAELTQGGLLNRIIKKYLVKFTYPHADKIIALSNSMKYDILNFIRSEEKSISVIYNPINQDEIKLLAQENINEQLFDNEYPIICTSARVVPHKGHKVIISAIELLKAKDRNVNLLCLGDGPDIVSLSEVVNSLGLEKNIKFIGYVSNPFKYIANSSIFVLASEYEGMPNSLIQAMSLNIPVIASDSPGACSEVLMNGKIGKLFPVGDYKKLAQLIDDTIDNRLKINYKLERFNEIKILEQYRNLFDD